MRARHPLKRVGERGAGKWQRVSWDEALTDIADRMIDVIMSDGPGAIMWDQGAVTGGGAGLAQARTTLVLDTPVLDWNPEAGDHRPGVAVTLGTMTFCSSMDDLFHSDLIFIWGGNPVYTQIPNAHFIMEARYNSTRIVTIAPDYSASAIHADQWVPVRVGTDAALGLSMAHVMIEEGIYDRRFVREQTDLPLLVHSDTGRFLRQSEVQAGGQDDRFYIFDGKSRQVVLAPHDTLALGALDPELEGEFEIGTRNGKIRVTPVFARLRAHLKQYVPEAAVKICGVDPETIRALARQLARARAATCLCQSNFSKYYHAIEMERAQILCFALAGQMGRKGAGYLGFAYLSVDSVDGLAVAAGKDDPKTILAAVGLQMAPLMQQNMAKGYTPEMSLYDLARKEYGQGSMASSMVWLYHQVGMADTYGHAEKWDSQLRRPAVAYMEEAVEKGWVFKGTSRPRIFMEAGGNALRRWRAYDRIAEKLLPMLDLMVTIDWRMSTTGLYSDYVLPAAAWYEKDDITWATPLAPFSQIVTRAVEPLGEAKADWEFYCLLLKTIQRRATERGLHEFADRHGNPRTFDVYDQFTFGGRYTEKNPTDFLDLVLELSTNTGGVNWEQLRKKGFQRFTGVGNSYANIGNSTDVKANETITAGLWHTEKKMPWPTLTRRMQFCIDHPFYEELGEMLPVHKDPPRIGGNYPLQLTGGHTRWSIHGSWRDQKYMLQLNRGQPVIFIGTDDAADRGISDGDSVRLFNDIGSSELMAKVSPSLRRGQVTVYHAWEPFMARDRKTASTVTPSPINPISLAGGYFHIQPRPAEFGPGPTDRATRVEVEKIH
ncbi:MAG: molybdopterin-dependent oxidoreductase [Gammaproteobacteria bacterium]|nr:molybdopterin-dependent oxidoreductase [Gammaproteobacteria bacterium]